MIMMPVATAASVYALLTDGAMVEVRPATSDDVAAVTAFHEALSADSIYQRFFSLGTSSAEREAQRICRAPGSGHAALLAVRGTGIVGVATYELGNQPGTADVSVVTADDMARHGVATLLLEHLGSAARRAGIRAFTSPVLAVNTRMLKVAADAGLHIQRKRAGHLIEVTADLPGDDADPWWEPYLDAVGRRESLADVASLRHVFQPRSVAVIGAGRRAGSVGRVILRNIVAGGYSGRIFAVNPHAASVAGIECSSSVAGLPEAPDLAVVAVPPPAVPRVAAECGQRGVKALVVITAGLDDTQGEQIGRAHV